LLIVFWQGKAVGTNKRLLWNPKLHRNVPNPEYKRFIQDMAWRVKLNGCSFPGKIDVTLEVTTWKLRDTDSLDKPCLDALEQGGVVKNDNQVRDLQIKRLYHKKGELDTIRFFISEVKL
jgi:Holliday junction resolvase RusA-like endonuclease